MSTPNSAWRHSVLARDGFRCSASVHDPRCKDAWILEAHYIVYKSHLIKLAYWIIENGITLSNYCHARAHLTHNKNIDEARLTKAVDAVNLVQGDLVGFRRPYFQAKAL